VLGVVALLMLAASSLQSASACGWWGDGESDGDDEAITINGNGRSISGVLPLIDTPESLTRQANQLRLYGPSAYAGAIRLYRKAAASAYAPAQNNLGVIYEEGLGVAIDLTEAARWYRLAADQGEAHAQHSLGEMLLTGRGTRQDINAGIQWIMRAGKQGHASACADIARFYMEGRYLKKDGDKAIYWWQQAEKFGFPEAREALNKLTVSQP